MTTTLDPGTPAEPAAPRPARLPRDPRERLAALFDAGTLDLLPAGGEGRTGVVAGVGLVHGAGAVAFASDPRVQGGAMGSAGCAAIVGAYSEAVSRGVPVVGLWHSGGARLAEGVASLHAVGTVFAAMTAASGRVPQISVVLGPAAGGAAYGPALTDIVILSGQGKISDDDAGCDLSGLLPDSARRAYDVHALTDRLLDAPGIELHPRWAPNIVTILGRLAGRTVGVVANNPMRLGGCLDVASAEKSARFVRMCDAFGVPLVVLVDTPGYLPGVGQEWDGVVRCGAKLLHAFAEAVVPRVTLVTRKAYGGAYIAMNSRSLGATRVFAWPGAEVAVMGAVAAIRILHRRTLASVPPERRSQAEAELAAEHEATVGGLQRAVDIGVVDAIIDPRHTRQELARAIAEAPQLKGAHANIPL